MSYISGALSKNRKEVLVWERDSDGQRVLSRFDTPYDFYVEDAEGDKQDIWGRSVTHLDFESEPYKFYNYRDKARDMGLRIYESDINPVYKVLSKNYYKAEINQLNVSFYDIEVDYDKSVGYSNVKNPYAPVNAIAIYHRHLDKIVVYAVPPENRKGMDVLELDADIRDIAEIHICSTEKELLLKIIEEFENSDIISGWNSDFFDTPYLYKRISKVLGDGYSRRLCFDGAPPPKVVVRERFHNEEESVVLYGRVSVDYLELFKKFEVKERMSNSLEAISEEFFPDKSKLEYTGTLYDLYRDDFSNFLRYNIRDTEVLRDLDARLGYMDLAIEMSHMATSQINDVLGTIKIAENSIINYAHYELDMVVPDNNRNNNDYFDEEKFAGALVLDPQVGMHEWISSVDIASLYPSAIRTTNISPETVYGQFIDKHVAYEYIKEQSNVTLPLKLERNGDIQEMTGKEWYDYLDKNKMTISGYGTVFSTDKKGIIPSILTDWYFSRVEFKQRVDDAKNKMKILEKEGNKNTKEYKKLKQEASYCHKIQYIKKIQLNSMYGALGNKWFKFFDIRLAESTTRTGREILMHMVKEACLLLDGEYTWPSESAIYSDTDSVYFKTHATNKEEAVKTGKILEGKINKSFTPFVKKAFHSPEGYDDIIVTEQEIVADAGIFVSKKLYALHLVYLDGHDVDDMKVMGLQIKKTTLPVEVRKKLTNIVRDILVKREMREIKQDIVDLKDYLMEVDDIMLLGLPSGIKKLEDYTRRYNNKEEGLRLPGHVSASIFWNGCLTQYDDHVSDKIMSGYKIRKFYLLTKFGTFRSIAVPSDLKEIPDWFKDNYLELIDRRAQVERLVDKPLKNIFNAIGLKTPTKKSLLVEDMAEY